MSNIRFRALETALNRQPVNANLSEEKVSDYFAQNVFNQDQMLKYLSKDAFRAVMDAINHGVKIDRKMAGQVAIGMKEWANSKGATHYTHWFQPLTGLTAEKHDSFFEVSDGKALEHFSAGALVQQEPDASSFPSGGIRNTFEARGYTAWDPSSPAFIMERGGGKTLCIPTIFVSYTGETLDNKTPLLKALTALDKAAVEVCQYFDKDVTKVHATLGVEQEYFLVDTALLNTRPDLAITGRTLFGHAPAKGQQLEDHYFGSIPERVYAFMRDFETESYKLGIPLRTRHNEVAPAQFECAPIFEEVSVAVDHNTLLMDIMDRVARRHKLRVLLHEKPFAGINGSGKHNNWSMATDTGKNLLSPGRTPKTNFMFLTFFVNTIKAVEENADLIRASIASAGNDFRLGANEAPPAIISVFIGSYLSDVLSEVEKRVKKGTMDEQDQQLLKLDIHNKIPDLMLDNTDRNRTSPFAFTGNKFEVRAVGSSANCSSTMTVLNSIVATQLKEFKKEVDALIAGGETKDTAILSVLQKYITSSKRICFEGNNYSDEWAAEAKKRGLNNVKTTPEALDFYVSKKAIKVFTENNVLSEKEIHARHEIELEKYMKKVQIEGRMIGEIAMTHIVPAAVRYQQELAQSIQLSESAGVKEKSLKQQKELLNEMSEHISSIIRLVDEMTEARKKANEIEHMREKAIAYCHKVKPFFDEIREHCDKLELVVSDDLWSLPKYRELLFLR